jgi:hypothetical protein
MSTPNLAQLAADIDHAVNPAGGNPKITGPALNALLHELVAELAVDPAELSAGQTPFLFQVGVPGIAPIAQLSLDQAKQLAANPGTSITLRTDVINGHYYELVIGYDGPNNRFVIERITSDTGDPVNEGWQVGAGIPPAPLITPLDYQEAQAIANTKGTNTFRKGAFYRLINRPNQTLGVAGDVVVQAESETALSSQGCLLGNVPDYANLPTWFPTNTPLGTPTGEVTYQYAVTNTYNRLVPDPTDLVSPAPTGDDNFEVVQLPFPFNYGGVTYTEYAVDTNGRIMFGSANYNTNCCSIPKLGTSQVPVIAVCWTDLMVGTSSNLSIFTTGAAPYRRHVIDYYQTNYAYNYRFIYSRVEQLTQSFTGQIILDEYTGNITLATAQNGMVTQFPMVGLQYAGHSYFPYGDGVLPPPNTTVVFTPTVVRAPTAPVSYTGTSPVIWAGQTWDLVGTDKTVEPGTDPAAWVPHTSTSADAFGNTLPVAHTVTYELTHDAILQRSDTRGNSVTGNCAGFPWGAINVHDNQLVNTSLDKSLLTTPNLTLFSNSFRDCQLSQLHVSGIEVSHNRLTQVSLTNYAPASFTGVIANYGLDHNQKGLANQQFSGTYQVQDPRPLISQAVSAFKARYVDPGMTVYKDGQAPQVGMVNFTGVWPHPVPPHDIITWHGFDLQSHAIMANVNITGDATMGVLRLGYLTASNSPGYVTTLKGLNMPNSVSLGALWADMTSGHDFHLIGCTISLIDAPGDRGSTVKSTYMFSHCVIGSVGNINNGKMARVLINNASIGRGHTSGAIFAGTRTNSSGDYVVTNSTIYLLGTTTLFDPGLSPLYYPTFRNCTVVAADGTVTSLNTNIPLPPAPTSLIGTRTTGIGVHVSWNASANARMYHVYRNIAGAGFQLLATIPYPYFDDASSSAAAAGVSIQYYVQAANTTGLGAASVTITVNS